MPPRYVIRALVAVLVVALLGPCTASIVHAAMPAEHPDADCTTRLCDLPTGCTAPTVLISAVVPVAVVPVVESDASARHAERLGPASPAPVPTGPPARRPASRSPPLV